MTKEEQLTIIRERYIKALEEQVMLQKEYIALLKERTNK